VGFDSCSSDCQLELKDPVPKYQYGPLTTFLIDPSANLKVSLAEGTVNNPALKSYWVYFAHLPAESEDKAEL